MSDQLGHSTQWTRDARGEITQQKNPTGGIWSYEYDAAGKTIRAEQPSTATASAQDAATLSTTALAEMERMTILRVFEQANGDKALAGKMLGISRATLYRKLKQHGLEERREGEVACEENALSASA